MTTTYNRIAGKNLHRLEGLSDGVFAIVMTLLVLELHAPAAEAIRSEKDLWAALVHVGPHLLTFFMSFLTLGIFWVGQQTQFNFLARSDRDYTWLNILFLMMVSLVPFSTALLAGFITYKVAIVAYWANILLLGITLGLGWYAARRLGLTREDAPKDLHGAIIRRIVFAQTLYAIGMALCFVDTWLSIFAIFAVQSMYAIGPRRGPFKWL